MGARQHAKVVCNILKSSKHTCNSVEVVGFVDDNPELHGATLLGLPILGKFTDLPNLKEQLQLDAAIMGISNRFMNVRRKYFERFRQLGFKTVNAIHNAAVIDPEATLGVGIVLNPSCVVNTFAKVGDNVVAYSGSTIEHEDIIDNNVYLGPGVNMASGVQVGEDTFLGAGTKVIPDIAIGKNVTVGAGSVVVEDIPDNSIAVGAPARVIKTKWMK